jgi:Leucine-rich repeat (LRR) protein
MGQIIKECCGREERECACGENNKPNKKPKTICPNCGADITSWESREAFGTPHTIDCKVFPDPNLETAIREVVNKPEGSLSSSDLEKVIVLIASGRNISNLTGLEYCVNLQELYLSGNHIRDISPLAGISKLEWLYLDHNNISDISALDGLINLKKLVLYANNISDISALAGLVNLQVLYLGANNISDISVLASLTNLEYLDLRDNNITDLSQVENVRGKLPLDCYFYANHNPCFKGETNG